MTVGGQTGKQFGSTLTDTAKATQVVTVFVHSGRVVSVMFDRDEFAEDDALIKAFLDKIELKAAHLLLDAAVDAAI